MKLFGRKGHDREPSISLIGKPLRREGRPGRALRPLWDASTIWRRLDDEPSWRLPPLWEGPSDGEEYECLIGRSAPGDLPAYKRAWRQPALF
jgi:hypothetical protein